MPAAEDWMAVVAQIRLEADPFQSLHLGRLYELALADGPKLLGSFRRQLDDERIVDLVHDLLASKLEAIVSAEQPRALFCTALQRRAISWLRRGDAHVVENSAEETTLFHRAGQPGDERQGFVLDARALLNGLPARDRAMVVAVALGEEREAIAAEFGTSRANVDQIVRRVRKKFEET